MELAPTEPVDPAEQLLAGLQAENLAGMQRLAQQGLMVPPGAYERELLEGIYELVGGNLVDLKIRVELQLQKMVAEGEREAARQRLLGR